MSVAAQGTAGLVATTPSQLPDQRVRLTAAQVDSELARVLFGPERAGKPVYALPDAEGVGQVAEAVGVSRSRGTRLLASVAASEMGLSDTTVRPFRKLATQSWFPSSGGDSAPPGLTILAVLSLAADKMHADDQVAANNYYGRLHDLLETPESRRAAVEHGYRHYADALWERLNRWLEYWDGARGVPTAYAVGHMHYIGLPLSQAVMRHEDRGRLRSFFVDEALPPGYHVASSEMETLLDPWMTGQHHFTKTARVLWTNPQARERIALAATYELEAWDGTGQETRGDSRARERQAQLIAQLRSFPSTRIELNLSLPGGAVDGTTVFAVATPAGDVDFDFDETLAGRLQLRDPTQVESESLLNGQLTIRGTSTLFVRRPRRVVPFRFDELSTTFVEVETIQLGEPSLVLTVDDLADQTGVLLSSVARPGWSQLPAHTPGIPAGWVVFRDVEMYCRGETNCVDLAPLLPRASLTLAFSGGVALPGLLRKWSSLAPPEVHAISGGAHRLEIVVQEASTPHAILATESVEASVGIVRLAECAITDGEYQVIVRLDGQTKPAAMALLRLRSAATPELQRSTNILVHGPARGNLWPLTADSPDDSAHVDGARVNIDTTHDTSGPAKSPGGVKSLLHNCDLGCVGFFRGRS